MGNRATGWIQDPGKIENLIKVVEIFDKNTYAHSDLKNKIIPLKVYLVKDQHSFISQLNSTNGYKGNPKIKYQSLVGTAFTPRKNAKCNGIIQALIPGQKRPFISDWPANNFIRWAETLGFISFDKKDKTYTITSFGLILSTAKNSEERFNVIKTAFLMYPPVVRILELLFKISKNHKTALLTKFELGKELGFRGEDGFTNYPQSIIIKALNDLPKKRKEIISNWEGSSDKYARMICSWLSHPKINWVMRDTKQVTELFDSEEYTTNISQSYKITSYGVIAYKKARAKSSQKRIPKRIFFEMLATKGIDRSFLRTRRFLIIQYLKNWHTIDQIFSHLKSKGLKDTSSETILDDLNNIERIGLYLKKSTNSSYKIADKIVNLKLPEISITELIPSNIVKAKTELSKRIKMIDHSFFDLIDLGFDPQQNRLFEFRIVELLNKLNNAKSVHLSGGNRPEIIFITPKEYPKIGFIIDSKSYKKGFSLPGSERDKMIRYINEYKQKNSELNPNKWWENFKSPDYPKEIRFNYVSGRFIGFHINQIKYIRKNSNIKGGVIDSTSLIEKIDDVLNPDTKFNIYDLCNDLSTCV